MFFFISSERLWEVAKIFRTAEGVPETGVFIKKSSFYWKFVFVGGVAPSTGQMDSHILHWGADFLGSWKFLKIV